MQNVTNTTLIKGVLFDLDGTLLDTAPDMADALNAQRAQHQLAPLPFAVIRPYVGYGTRALLKIGFEIDDTHANYQAMAAEYLDLYEQHIIKKTAFFPHVEQVLTELDAASLPWGIVTNKPKRFAHPLFDAFGLVNRAACLVCGDTLPKRKPHPDQILYAAAHMQFNTSDLVYVGDTDIDVAASKQANMPALVALYGYIHADENPYAWQANGYLQSILDIIPWLQARRELAHV